MSDVSLEKNHEPWGLQQYCISHFNFKIWTVSDNLTSILIKIQILENFYMFNLLWMLKIGMEHRARYLVVLLQISDDISDIEKSAGYARYQMFFGNPAHP